MKVLEGGILLNSIQQIVIHVLQQHFETSSNLGSMFYKEQISECAFIVDNRLLL